MPTCYSWDEEYFEEDISCALERAVESFLEDNDDFVGETEIQIFSGEKVKYTIGQFCPQIAENLTDAAYSVGDEASEDWINDIEYKRKDLQTLVENALEQWANQNDLQPSFWGVEKVSSMMVKIKVDKDGNWEDTSE